MCRLKLGGGNSNVFYFHPYLGEDDPSLTNIFQMWLKPPTSKAMSYHVQKLLFWVAKSTLASLASWQPPVCWKPCQAFHNVAASGEWWKTAVFIHSHGKHIRPGNPHVSQFICVVYRGRIPDINTWPDLKIWGHVIQIVCSCMEL